jgi:hypothetical protein
MDLKKRDKPQARPRGERLATGAEVHIANQQTLKRFGAQDMHN